MLINLCLEHFLFHLKLSGWILALSDVHRHVRVQTIQQVKMHFVLFWHQNTKKHMYYRLGHWSCISVCVYASSLAFLSDHGECDKWMCQSLMEHCDCSARHKAITRLYRQPQRKILFQSTTHNLGDKERCSTVDRKSQALILKEDRFCYTLHSKSVSILESWIQNCVQFPATLAERLIGCVWLVVHNSPKQKLFFFSAHLNVPTGF